MFVCRRGNRIAASLLRCARPLLALSGHIEASVRMSAFGVKRTCREGARAEKRSASRTPSVVTLSGSGPNGRRLRGLQIACGLLAPLGHDVVVDLLAFHEGAHAGALD